LNELSDSFLLASLVILIFISAFFSSSETGMMALNPYKLKHRVKQGQKSAIRAQKLLDRPDRLIGIILIGNNLVNIVATSIATLLAVRWYGDLGLAVLPFVFTAVILVFAEVTPKTFAAQRPETIAFPASVILTPLLWLLMPFVWLVNHTSNLLLKMLGIKTSNKAKHVLSADELKTVVEEGGQLISPTYKGMLLNILDLDEMTVEDIMIPRNEVICIDMDDDMSTLEQNIMNSDYTRLPVVNGDINQVVGVLHLRNAIPLFRDEQEVNKDALLRSVHEPYFVPESTPLSTMLVNFQREQRRVGLVVDEYGDVQGLVTLEDLLEEIVGRFTNDSVDDDDEILIKQDGSASIDATALIRDVNKALDWQLPTDGPKTINGLIVEHLESIPDAPVSVLLGDYIFEVTSLTTQRIDRVNARPR
jgi:Mg2+/Co2+ transporter CorB